VKVAQRLAVSFLAAGLWLFLPGSAFAARLVTAVVQLDGQTVLSSKYQDNDFWGAPPGPAVVWRYLGKEPMWAEEPVLVTADAAQRLEAKLKGSLDIRLQHVNHLIVQAKASELTLIRANPSSDKWFLPTEEVERLALANGIPGLRSPSHSQEANTWLGLSIATVVLVGSVSAWLLIRSRQEHPVNNQADLPDKEM
jgi:hypothetical protein